MQRNSRFDVDLSHVKRVVEEDAAHHSGKINIALHIGNNRSYQKVNSSQFTVYQHMNTLQNYFLVANQSKNDSHLSVYSDAVRVFLYQHEWGGYACRDCYKKLSSKAGLKVRSTPLNSVYRHEWDKLPVRKRRQFDVLYGSLSFGVCESVNRPCNYMVLVPHPIDRVLQIYLHCKNNSSSAFCHFDKLNITKMSLSRFIKNQGSGFFKKLLYYSRHCRLVGEDELCLKDAAFSFSTDEKQIHLKHILDNLHKWFSVVGLVEHYSQSMQLFQSVFKQNYTSCPSPKFEQKDELFLQLRQKIEKDKQSLKYLHADIAIYKRFEQIFQQQLEIYTRLSNKSRLSVNSTSILNVTSSGNDTVPGNNYISTPSPESLGNLSFKNISLKDQDANLTQKKIVTVEKTSTSVTNLTLCKDCDIPKQHFNKTKAQRKATRGNKRHPKSKTSQHGKTTQFRTPKKLHASKKVKLSVNS